MAFNSSTLLSLVFGLLIPLVVIIYFCTSKQRKQLAYDSIAYGFVSFLMSIVAAFIAFVAANALFSSVSFNSDSAAYNAAGGIICFLVAVVFVVCESLKFATVKHFQSKEDRNKMSALGYSAGVVLAQNAALFVALNMFSMYEMDMGFALFSGAILCVTGIMYAALSYACELMIANKQTLPAYAISSVYYLFWICAVLSSRSTVFLYISLAFFFILSLTLGGVFIVRSKK